MKRAPLWFPVGVLALPVFGAFIQCGAAEPPLAPINTVAKSAAVVFRAKLQGCNTSSDCIRATVTPRCALDSVDSVYCDTSDAGGQPMPPGKSGFCAWAIPIDQTSRCVCYEGDIRYCDLSGTWNTCTAKNPGGCGIQMCVKGPQGSDPSPIPPGPMWGPCQPQVGPPPVVDAGDDAGNDGGTILRINGGVRRP